MNYDVITPDNFDRVIDEVTGSTRHATRDRPYDGQPHTDQGERGKTPVSGLTIRDVCDCIVMGMLESSPNEAVRDTVLNGTWMYKDVYAIGDIDPIAAVQNAACNIEKMMGIFPNVPMISNRFEEEST